MKQNKVKEMARPSRSLGFRENASVPTQKAFVQYLRKDAYFAPSLIPKPVPQEVSKVVDTIQLSFFDLKTSA